jgi:hypothetical protein
VAGRSVISARRRLSRLLQGEPNVLDEVATRWPVCRVAFLSDARGS